MSNHRTKIFNWLAEAKPAWNATLKTIRQLDVSSREPWGEFFEKIRQQINFGAEYEQMLNEDQTGSLKNYSLEELKQKNHQYYADLLPGPNGYQRCLANPDYSTSRFGLETGQLVSALYSSLRLYRYWARTGNYPRMSQANQLFLTLHRLWQTKNLNYNSGLAAYRDYLLTDMEMNTLFDIYQGQDPDYTLYRDILQTSDFSDSRYLYRFGIYVEPEILEMADFISAYREEDLRAIAHCLVKAYLLSFKRNQKRWQDKKFAGVHYPMGMERLALMVSEELNEIGLTPAIGSPEVRGANEQYNYDSRFNQALYLDQDYADRRSEIIKDTINEMAGELKLLSGHVKIMLFGQSPFVPELKSTTLRMTAEQDKLRHQMGNQITNCIFKVAPREDTSFSVIAFPSTEIGENFEEIFAETLEINRLDSMHYAKIQECLIDILDKAEQVHVRGIAGNDTDIYVKLTPLSNPEQQTRFENCTADLNIPVGEVFTSPQLKGTSGILHIPESFLNDLKFVDLRLEFTDGMISDYSCGNFTDDEENRRYIFENLLKPNKTLPIGEFAIGTNTRAYQMARKYGITHLLPVLIIEKMGPHFAIGDTCYCHAEDSNYYGLISGKQIVATENEKSALRRTDPDQAYTHKHWDITLPYDMLAEISALMPDGSRVPLIKDGRFAAAGTEELNQPLENL